MGRRDRDKKPEPQDAPTPKEQTRGTAATEKPDARDGASVRGADEAAGGEAAGAAAPDPGPEAGVEDRVPAVDREQPGASAPFEDGSGFPPPVLDPMAPGEPFESAEDLSDLPEALQMAIVCFDLKRAHVLDHRLTDDGVVLVTRGGRKLTWPGDEAKAAALTPQDKGEPGRDFPPANLFGKRG
jgi:hypothetical protein